MKIQSIPSQIVIKVGMCLMALALLVLAALWPQQNHLKELKADIAAAKADVRRQNALLPKYTKLKIMVDKGLPEAVPPLREVHLTQDSITEIQGLVMAMADARGAFAESIAPDPSSLASGGGELSVNCIMHGPLESLRGVLLDLGTMSSLHHIETISIRQEGLEAVMQLKAWMTLE